MSKKLFTAIFEKRQHWNFKRHAEQYNREELKAGEENVGVRMYCVKKNGRGERI